MSTIHVILKSILLIALPVVVFQVGGAALKTWSGRADEAKRAPAVACPDARAPLYQRLGYDAAAMARHWETRDLTVERKFLQLDLAFPFFYGGALAASLWMAWAMAGRPFSPAWVLAPAVIAVLSDWTENLVQLGQLRRYATDGAAALQPAWIQVASTATTLKLVFISNAALLLLALLVAAFLRARSLE